MNYEIIVDNFAGGGGASTGIELATGRPVTAAINHDADAIAMHRANHLYTKHLCESVWDVDPREVCAGRKIALAWFSPDCKHFSRAKGGTPLDKNIRGLAWVAIRWASLPENLKPRVIVLENVEEFKTWGPLIENKPDPARKGQTFNAFVRALERHGYAVEHKELRACDYGAPTIRKRLFLIARSDGRPVAWPKPTHGPGLIPYRTAAEIIDWSLPCPSIFDTSEEIHSKYGIRAVRPLADATMERIAKGIKKFVLENPQPYIMPNNTNNVPHMVTEPVPTITSANRNYLCMPYLMHYHAKTSQFETRGQDVSSPLHTIDTNPRHALVAAFLSKYYGGPRGGFASGIDQPVGTITAMDHNALCSAFLCCLRNNMDGKSITEPVPTITSGGCHIGAVKVFLNKYLGTNLNDMPTVNIGGQYYLIYDIGMRMLIPRELYLAQGFPIDYVIDRDISGRPYPKSKQIARCGNAVPPPFAEAITRANLPELCGRKIDTMQEWRSEAAAGI